MARKWKGIYPAIVLPFNDRLDINESELRSLARWLVSVNGVSGIVCNGHAGEIGSLDRDERKRVIELLVDEVGSQVPIVSGISSESTREAVQFAADAKDAGAAGLLLMPVHSWLRFGRQAGVPEAFFGAVAEVGLPIIVHQYPAWTKTFYPAETLLKLTEIPGVEAIKMGERNFSVFEYNVRLLREHAPEVSLLSCHDEFLFPTLLYDLDGALVGFGSIVPEIITGLFAAVNDGDLARAKAFNNQLFVLKQAIYGDGEPSGAAHARGKEMLRQLGLISNAIARPPVLPISAAEVERIALAIEQAGLRREAQVQA